VRCSASNTLTLITVLQLQSAKFRPQIKQRPELSITGVKLYLKTCQWD